MTTMVAMDYNTLLTDDQKRQILAGRIQQFAAEAYQITLNQKVLEGTEDTASIEANAANLATLEKAIQIHQAELETLAPPTETPVVETPAEQ